MEKVHLSKNLGERFKAARKRSGLNQKQFGEKLRKSASHISEIESGKSSPSESLISLVGFTFGINESWLLTGEGEMFRTPEAREPQAEYDSITEKILLMLANLDEEKKRDVLKYLEKEKLLADLLKERKDRGEAG